MPNANVGFCMVWAFVDCEASVVGFAAMALNVLFALDGCPNTNDVFEVLDVAGTLMEKLPSARSVFGRFFAFVAESSIDGLVEFCPNVNIGFGASTGPFVAGFTKTFSNNVIPLFDEFAFAVGPPSVTSFDSTFDPNIGVFVGDENWKPPNEAGWLGAAEAVVAGFIAPNENDGVKELLPNRLGVVDTVVAGAAATVDVKEGVGVDVVVVLLDGLPNWKEGLFSDGFEPKLNALLLLCEPNTNF